MAKMVLAEERTKPLKNLALENIDTDEAAQNITVAQAIRHYLEQIGVEYVFGVPGGAIVVLFDELCKSDYNFPVTPNVFTAIIAAAMRFSTPSFRYIFSR